MDRAEEVTPVSTQRQNTKTASSEPCPASTEPERREESPSLEQSIFCLRLPGTRLPVESEVVLKVQTKCRFTLLLW